ncbi:UPF0280 family protein [Marinibacterium profundimaris]|uniref:Thiamine biosynthesis protein ApbE n=1 Tax=Marinibacterium profundimaris TaxID=1679460 RepID=A0A225NLU5_9RHOB|nr:UPF0280 family protein [Marinibacterium profundimaris]OWU74903.1 hypothetical protein ATO3_10090 [Marinibacterium profundimaris]
MSDFTETQTTSVSTDGRRMRLAHGPIDMILTAEGPAPARQAAFDRARLAFLPVLDELAQELPRLRAPTGPAPTGSVAGRMTRAAALFAPRFVTPMAAVAGSIADHIREAVLVQGHGLTQLIANNGGDISLWLARGAVTAAICDDPISGRSGGKISISARSGIGGVATSGWRGRSFSMGIADAVTVLADRAATADVAATLIANAVDLPDHPGILRQPANELSPDSDLGARLVTTDVAPLSVTDRAQAIERGYALAQEYIAHGLIRAAYLSLEETRAVAVEKEILHA